MKTLENVGIFHHINKPCENPQDKEEALSNKWLQHFIMIQEDAMSIKINSKSCFGRTGFMLYLLLFASAAMISFSASPAQAQHREQSALAQEIDKLAGQIEDKVIAWRRDIHQHPELSNREYKTAELVANHLKSLGLDVKTGVSNTGVVGFLKGGKPGPVVALRADMDALPVTEETGLPFASKARAEYNGNEVGVMHACGHDNHVAMLMGVAEILASMKDRLPGSVKFIFQPAEEGAPAGENSGAMVMIDEGVLENPKPDVIFGQHVTQDFETGSIGYKAGGAMASVNTLHITVKGKQTHGAYPWNGVDPIVTAAQIIMGLQTIISRQSDLTVAPAVVTIGIIEGGIRSNIIPDEVKMTGTIRTLDPDMKEIIHERIRRIVKNIAESAGASADVNITGSLPVTWNDHKLVQKMLPTLERVTGENGLVVSKVHTGGEDFAFFSEKIPGFYFFLGVRPKGTPAGEAKPLHSPFFFADESALTYGVRAMASVAVDYMVQE